MVRNLTNNLQNGISGRQEKIAAKVVYDVYVHGSFTCLPLMTHWQLYVCGDTSWWTEQAFALEHSYINPPCTKTDDAQQFSTVCGCGDVAGNGESCWVSLSVEVNGCCRLKIFGSWWFSSSKLLMQQFSCSTCCSSAEIFWTSNSQLSAHWLLTWHSCMQGREEGESLLI